MPKKYKQHDTITGYDFRKDPPLTPRKAIKEKCIECCGGSIHEAKQCQIYDCPLWPLRPGGTGIRKRKPMSPEARAAASERMKQFHKTKGELS